MALPLLFASLLAGCASLGYYGQALRGGWEVHRKQRPIPRLLTDPALDPGLKARLRLALEIRDFASRNLGLPDNRSYRTYADLGRPYATWTVVATPELSLEPLQWCFPIAGCVTYRGYFRKERAERFAAELAAQGHDVEVGGVTAYSTLGWLTDPVLNTFIGLQEVDLAGLLFHELAHQVVYVRDDTPFNESFATVVEREGVRRWLLARGRAEELAAYRTGKAREKEVLALLLAYRERLAEIYASDRPDARKRREKAALFAELEADYRRLRESWGGASPYDAWFSRGLNNARLAALGAYHDLAPHFEALLQHLGGDLPAFYAQVREMARLPAPERRGALERIVTSPDLSGR